jgi:RimJ/RimL family protein N-acetyltransferase
MMLRSVVMQDADMLLTWRNDQETRKASHSTAEVGRGEHMAWLRRKLTNPACRLFIAEENGVPVGTIRADLVEDVWELSWTTAPEVRGQGIATRMAVLLACLIVEPIRAEVKVDNLASARIAERAGMTFERETGGILHYRRAALC